MQFPVPQFIDVEDKIIGPFTLKQFGFIFGGGLIEVLLFRTLGLGIVFFLLGIPIALLTLGISFGQFNGKHIYEVIPVFLKFLGEPKVLVFHKNRSVSNLQITPITVETFQNIQKQNAAPAEQEPVQNRLKNLSRMLDQKNQEEAEILKNNQQ